MTASQLLKAARSRKCIVGAIPTNKHMPAAFICSMQFWSVAERLPHMTIYNPKRKIKIT